MASTPESQDSRTHPPHNLVVLRGHLSRPAATRELPSGDVLGTFDVTVARDDGPDETVPVVWFDPPATARSLDAGEAVVVLGRVRRRFFRAGGRTASSTEVVAEALVPARQRKRAAGLVATALERLEP